MNERIAQSMIELKQAEQNFNFADPEFVDIAVIHLLAANMKVNMLLNLRKQVEPDLTCNRFQKELTI